MATQRSSVKRAKEELVVPMNEKRVKKAPISSISERHVNKEAHIKKEHISSHLGFLKSPMNIQRLGEV